MPDVYTDTHWAFFFERTEHILASNSIELSADSSGYIVTVSI